MRKILSVFLSLTLLMTLFAGSAMAKPGNGASMGKAKTFKDIEGHWGKPSIIKIQPTGLFNGYDDGTFRPDNMITQAEVAVLIDRLVEMRLNSLNDDDEVLNDDDEVLNDVPDWAKKAVKKGAKNKYLNLKRFHSQVQCDRLMACVQIAKALGLEPVDNESINPFKDRGLMSDEDYGYLLALYKAGFIKGDPNGNFNPNSFLKRAEMASIIERILGDDDEDVSNDKTAPNWPSDSALTGSNIESTSVYLTWTAASDNEKVTGYKITYNFNSEEKEKLVLLNRSTTISGLEPDEDYEFTVEARDAAGNWSDDGPSVELTTKESSTIEDLTNPNWSNESLTASSITSSGVILKWSGADDNIEVTKYRIYRDEVLKYTVDADVETKIVTDLTEDTEYTFRVEAGDANGNWSTDGPEVDVTTNELPVSTDTTKPYWDGESLTTTNITETSVTLTWLGAEDNEDVTQYKIYVNEILKTTIDDGDVSTETITGLNNGTNYTLRVQAGDAAGNWSTDGPSVTISTQN